MIWVSLALALFIAWWFYRRTTPALTPLRRWLLLALRAVTLWVLLLLLLNPVLRRTSVVKQRPVAWLLQDVSLSMDAGGKAQQFDDKLHEATPALRQRGYETTVIPFAAGLDTGDPLRRQSTRLMEAMAEAAETHGVEHLRRIVLFSDGWLKDDQPDDALTLGVPIDVFAPAWRDSTFNLRITRLHAPDEVFAGENAPLALDAQATGFSGVAEVAFKLDGRDTASRQIDFSSGERQQLTLDLPLDRPGLHTVEAHISATDAPAPEPDTGDNRAPVTIHVRDSHPQALALCDRLDWEVPALRRGVGQLPGWETNVWQGDNGRWRHGQQRAPLASLIKDETRLIILVNHGELRISTAEAQSIERFVENGGGLLLLGSRVNALRDLLPGAASNVRQWFEGSFLLTDTANRYETFRRIAGSESDIPPVDYRYITAKPGAETLAFANNPDRSPLVVTWMRGQGRVLWFACLGLWRWQLWDENDTAAPFLADVASWLGQPAAQRFTAFTDRAGYRLGDAVQLRLHAFDERMNRQRDLQPMAVVTDSTGEKLQSGYLTANDDGEYNLALRNLPAGDYAYTISDERTAQQTTGQFAISPIGGEQQDRGVNRSLLTWLAQRSGGEAFDADLPDWSSVSPETSERRSELALYKKWWVITLFIVAFGVELFFRKRWGLL